jgi:exodeoxyribonuclease V alpha subunit
MIAETLGIPKTAMIRARAGISYALLNAVDDGQCGLPRDELLKLAEELLEIPTEILEDAINLELGDGMVVADTIGERQCVFMRKLWEAERTIAERFRSLRDGQPPLSKQAITSSLSTVSSSLTIRSWI